MPVPFTCPHCGLETNVADQYAGRTGPCSKCGNTVTVPAPSGATPFATPSAPTKSSTPVIVLVVLLVGAVLGTLLLCAGVLVWGSRGSLTVPADFPDVIVSEVGDSEECSNNLRRIALAMHNYHDTYRCLPPAVITDEQGTPRYSWRVAILPFLDQTALYDRWNCEEAWDSPNNSRIGQTALSAYRCPADEGGDPTETNYVMITGEETIGNLPNEATRFADIIDGTSNTIMIVEIVDSGIGWSEPRDLSLDELELQTNAPGGISSRHAGGVNVGLCDGSVRFVPESVSAADLRASITKGGGESPPNF